jgi:L-fuculose-phosphate aldolase
VTELQTRKQVVQTALRMNALGVNRGKSGNVSTRWKEGCLITPSGLAYEDTRAPDVVYIDAKGKATGRRAPSSEWRFHHDIYQAHPEIGAVVHTHSTFATTLACLNIEVPAFHYMIAIAGGDSIRCAPYATFGTQALSDHALRALSGRKACLLAQHGMIATGAGLDAALLLTVEVEALCEQYWRVLQIGKPEVLSAQEMATVLEKFKSYGQPLKSS